MDEVADYFYRLGARHVKHVERGFKPEYWTVFPVSFRKKYQTTRAYPKDMPLCGGL